ncbi:helix-turn-helix transcriptional regulator [Mucilaginibacter sp. 21P]|uniref:helix-turn-helix domain-containing protein n=1 Tax=Mucilaginibacter sp. 21P TaxID=2778902 RepID=UPI001C575375|nr:helix-turn-helix transcriptional regulator [Mucilaginibacter sp. 21P]QXV63733.1 helix-turn-helix transcriptional regulator [Mucilaginibacter sp. 21P]
MSKHSADSKKDKKIKLSSVTKIIGQRLKKKRISLKYSLSDVSEMIGISTATIVDMENGYTSDINYYITYALTLFYPLKELFDLELHYGPRFPLSEKKKARIYLTDTIKALFIKDNFFSQNRSVDDVAQRLIKQKTIMSITASIRSQISRILLTLVDRELLKVSGKSGRKKLYIRKTFE